MKHEYMRFTQEQQKDLQTRLEPQPDWEKTRLVFISAKDEYNKSEYQSGKELAADVKIVMSALESLQEWVRDQPGGEFAQYAEDITYLKNALPQDEPDLERDITDALPTPQLQRLQARLLSNDANLIERDERIPAPKSLSEDEKDKERETKEMVDILRDSRQLFLISASDSHRSTGSMFKALARLGMLDPKRPRAILSFDHHSDTKPDDFHFGKESVMGSILQKNLIDALAVVGIQEEYDMPPAALTSRIDFCEGRTLYTEKNKPDVSRFLDFCHETFKKWKQAGIIDIYPSIDLDGLRVDKLKYYGTDYSIPRIRRAMIYKLSSSSWTDSAANMTSLNPTKQKEVLKKLRLATYLYQESHKPYKGIPASWIAKALKLAKEEYGFHIGIRDPKKGRVIVGDVTELHEADYKDRTTRIARALLDRILAIAQEE